MGPTLRNRLSKRNTGSPRKKAEDTASNSPSLLSALDHLHQPATMSQENLHLTPPASLTLPREPDKLKSSPSKSLLQRYKGRASTQRKMPATSSRQATTKLRSKVPAFTENFGDSENPENLTMPPKAITSTAAKPTIRTVGGVDFQMLNASDSTMNLPLRNKSAEPPRGRSTDEVNDENSNKQSHNQRGSRSQTKKEERSDSTIDIPNNATMPPCDTPASGTPPSNLVLGVKPDSKSRLTLRKKNTSSDPSIPSRPKIPRVTRSSSADARVAARANSRTPPEVPRKNTPTDFADDSSSDDSESEDCTFILDNMIAAGLISNKSNQPIPTTRVMPPIHVSHILPGLVWTSPLGGTSRPDSPWLWCKRWTCCRCSAATIVEQQVCARLSCGHHRCGNQCKVARERRMY